MNSFSFKLSQLTNDITDLLNLGLTSTFSVLRQELHGTAMGSLVSVAVAEIVMPSIEEQDLATFKQTVPLLVTIRRRQLYSCTQRRD